MFVPRVCCLLFLVALSTFECRRGCSVCWRDGYALRPTDKDTGCNASIWPNASLSLPSNPIVK